MVSRQLTEGSYTVSTHPVNPSQSGQADASRSLYCNACKQSLPLDAFSPSSARRAASIAKCRQCQKREERQPLHIKEQRRKDNVALLRRVIGAREWTAVEAADVLQRPRQGIGQLLEPMCRDGFIVRLDEGRYRFADNSEPAAPEPINPEPVTPVRTPAAHMQVEPVFLEVGTYVFSPGTFAIERNDRGGAAITLLVAETDRNGKALPREIELTPEEWNSRRRVTLTDVVDGNASADLFERIGELEREAAKWKKDCDAAWALAQDYERQLNEYRQWDWVIKIAQQGKAA
jgi:hypothetical protein